MSFKDQTWERRFTRMGDEAESVFEMVCEQSGIGYQRYGLNRPPFSVVNLPETIRYTPDYLTEHSLVEVQGVGRDQIVKLKLGKFYALQHWSMFMPVELFLWDSANKRFATVPLNMVNPTSLEVDRFPEGHLYLELPTDHVSVLTEWAGSDAV